MLNPNADFFPDISVYKTVPSMIVNQKSTRTIFKVLLTAMTIFSLIRCSEEEITPSAPAIETEAAVTAATPANPKVASLTISGIHTSFSGTTNCTTCTYIVPGDIHVIDGKELNFKPGSTICLDSKIEYGNLEFVNMQGTADQPIIIAGYGGNISPASAEDATAQQTSAGDPY